METTVTRYRFDITQLDTDWFAIYEHGQTIGAYEFAETLAEARAWVDRVQAWETRTGLQIV